MLLLFINSNNIHFTSPGITHQGSTTMYRGTGIKTLGNQSFAKGHLNPVLVNSFDPEYVRATFVYTNAVPQYGRFNSGPWYGKGEKKIVDYVQHDCSNQSTNAVLYLLTGTSKFRLQVGAPTPQQDPAQPQVTFPK